MPRHIGLVNITHSDPIVWLRELRVRNHLGDSRSTSRRGRNANLLTSFIQRNLNISRLNATSAQILKIIEPGMDNYPRRYICALWRTLISFLRSRLGTCRRRTRIRSEDKDITGISNCFAKSRTSKYISKSLVRVHQSPSVFFSH